jgi:hypothetical protein
MLARVSAHPFGRCRGSALLKRRYHHCPEPRLPASITNLLRNLKTAESRFLMKPTTQCFLNTTGPPTRTAAHLCGAPHRTLFRDVGRLAPRITRSVYGSEIRPMSAHGGERIHQELSPSALTSPAWEVGPNRPIKRPRSPHSRLWQRRSPGRRVRGTTPTIRRCQPMTRLRRPAATGLTGREIRSAKRSWSWPVAKMLMTESLSMRRGIAVRMKL